MSSSAKPCRRKNSFLCKFRSWKFRLASRLHIWSRLAMCRFRFCLSWSRLLVNFENAGINFKVISSRLTRIQKLYIYIYIVFAPRNRRLYNMEICTALHHWCLQHFGHLEICLRWSLRHFALVFNSFGPYMSLDECISSKDATSSKGHRY